MSRDWQWTGFGLIIVFIGHFYSSWLHLIDHYHTDQRSQSRCLVTASTTDVPLITNSCPRRLATISCKPHTLTAGFNRYFLQLLAPGLNWTELNSTQLNSTQLNSTHIPRLTLRSLGANRIENTASNNSSSVASIPVVAVGTWCRQHRRHRVTCFYRDVP
jgi:hypothetical protein